jgi:hypothetical protein
MNSNYYKRRNAFEALITYSSEDEDEQNLENDGKHNNNNNINNNNDTDDMSENTDDNNEINDINDDNNKNTFNFRNSKFDNFLSKKKIFLKKNIYENKNNHKKIMCQNYLNDNFCTYNDKCLYAHNKDEQKIDIKRKKIFDILNSSSDLSNLEYYKNKDIYKELQLFTKICNDCILNKCTGGNNCKFGSPYEKYVICYDDLNYGSCNNTSCNKIHLTKRNLKPQYNNIYSSINKPQINNISMLTTFMNNINLLNNNTNNNNNNNNIDINNDNNDNNYNFDNNNFDNDIMNTTESIINYCNNTNNNSNNNSNNNVDSDTECEKSIFLDKLNFVENDNIISDTSDDNTDTDNDIDK